MELNSIIDIIHECDKKSIELPYLVSDRHDDIPPPRGFNIIANIINNLIEETSLLRDQL